MNERQIVIWAKGYVEAILNGEGVSREQIEHLMIHINLLVSKLEKSHPEMTVNKPQARLLKPDDDLPF